METKKWYQSKLFWLGVIQVIVGVLTYVSGNIETGTAFSVFGILTTALRLITNTGITF